MLLEEATVAVAAEQLKAIFYPLKEGMMYVKGKTNETTVLMPVSFIGNRNSARPHIKLLLHVHE